MAADRTRVRRKERKNIATGVAHVNSSFNNTKILISDVQGNAIAWSSAGTMGFKGSRKSTPYAAQLAAEDAARKAMEHGVRTLEVEVQGTGFRQGECPEGTCRSRVHDHCDSRCNPDSSQRLQTSEAAPGLKARPAGRSGISSYSRNIPGPGSGREKAWRLAK